MFHNTIHTIHGHYELEICKHSWGGRKLFKCNRTMLWEPWAAQINESYVVMEMAKNTLEWWSENNVRNLCALSSDTYVWTLYSWSMWVINSEMLYCGICHDNVSHICSGITCGRSLNGELYAQRLQNLICYRLFHGDFSSIYGISVLSMSW